MDGQRPNDIENRLTRIEELLFELCQNLNRSPADPSYISLDTAAQLSGKTRQAIAKAIQRENDKLDGLRVRRIKGAVHRRDFLHFLEHKANKHPGRGELLRAAIRGIGK